MKTFNHHEQINVNPQHLLSLHKKAVVLQQQIFKDLEKYDISEANSKSEHELYSTITSILLDALEYAIDVEENTQQQLELAFLDSIVNCTNVPSVVLDI